MASLIGSYISPDTGRKITQIVGSQNIEFPRRANFTISFKAGVKLAHQSAADNRVDIVFIGADYLSLEIRGAR